MYPIIQAGTKILYFHKKGHKVMYQKCLLSIVEYFK